MILLKRLTYLACMSGMPDSVLERPIGMPIMQMEMNRLKFVCLKQFESIA